MLLRDNNNSLKHHKNKKNTSYIILAQKKNFFKNQINTKYLSIYKPNIRKKNLKRKRKKRRGAGRGEDRYAKCRTLISQHHTQFY